MGGVQINERAEIMREKGGIIAGLFAGGEVAGGVHGKNRLGGSGLLGAVVYGRVAGASASKYLLDHLSTQKAMGRVNALTSQLFNSLHLQAKPDSLVITLGYAGDNGSDAASHTAAPSSSSSGPSPLPNSSAPKATAANAKTAAPTPTAADKGKTPSPPKAALKEYTLEEVAKHNTEGDCWVVVNGQVLNTTSFLGKHPGGKEAILLYAGKECSDEFNMLHKPDVVEKYAPEIIVGTCKGK